MVLSGRQTVLRGREGRALDVENVGGEGGNRSIYTPGRSPGQGTGSGGRGGERGARLVRLVLKEQGGREKG